ncbi:MAG: BrnT family toxin, partial [Pseudomonadota bacterium]
MRYEWDEDKRQANLEKHGLDFVDIRLFDWETARLEEDFFPGERRDRALGYLGLRLVLVIYTYDGETCRLIS